MKRGNTPTVSPPFNHCRHKSAATATAYHGISGTSNLTTNFTGKIKILLIDART
jgi:hypothetical protein